MEKLKIVRISRVNKTSKAGKPYVSLGLQVDKYGTQWLNGFGNASNNAWKEGDEIEVKVEKKEYNGKEYLNFETPKREDLLQTEMTKVRSQIFEIVQEIKKIKDCPTVKKELGYTSDGTPVPDFSQIPEPEDIGVLDESWVKDGWN